MYLIGKKYLFLLMIFSSFLFSHSGGTDSRGGHYNKKTGTYHYHHGYSAHQHINGECVFKSDGSGSIGQFIFWGTLGFLILMTFIKREGFGWFLGHSLIFIWYAIIIVIWYELFTGGRSWGENLFIILFFAYPTYKTIVEIIDKGIFPLGSSKNNSSTYDDIENQGAVDVDDF